MKKWTNINVQKKNSKKVLKILFENICNIVEFYVLIRIYHINLTQMSEIEVHELLLFY
jgi:DNA-binding ferritin-like protein